MLRLLMLCILLLASRPAFVQAPDQTPIFNPHNPRDYFDAASPFYNFADVTLKPWHLKATYEIYDGSKSEQGTFENWWASPTVYRMSWTWTGVIHDEWHTADGKFAYRGTGVLDYFEYALRSALLSPLPGATELDPSKYRLDRQSLSLGGSKLPCVMVIPLMPQHGKVQPVPMGLFPTYCFSDKGPIVRVEFSWGSLAFEFNKIVKIQNHYLPREIAIFEGKRQILTATIDALESISSANPALVPPADVPISTTEKVDLVSGVTNGMLLKKEFPVYPQDAKDAHVSGTVVIKGVIGRDGAIHDLQILQTPWPSLAASALWSVSKWRYKPYLLDGRPVEVSTTVNVIYTLGP
jgi:TonB family protein